MKTKKVGSSAIFATTLHHSVEDHLAANNRNGELNIFDFYVLKEQCPDNPLPSRLPDIVGPTMSFIFVG